MSTCQWHQCLELDKIRLDDRYNAGIGTCKQNEN